MIKLKSLIIENIKKTYSAVLIDEKSRNELLKRFGFLIPEGWDIIAHHMTIEFGKLVDNEGESVTLHVGAVGKDDKALAVLVSGYPSANKRPHITIAINRKGGAKPKDSNNIEIWEPVDGPNLTGKVQNL